MTRWNCYVAIFFRNLFWYKCVEVLAVSDQKGFIIMNVSNVMNMAKRCAPTAAAVLAIVGPLTYLEATRGPLAVNAAEDAKDRIETYVATKEAGLPYESYGRAKIALDSLEFEKICKELGVEPPEVPAPNASFSEYMNYQSRVMEIRHLAALKTIGEMKEALKTEKTSTEN